MVLLSGKKRETKLMRIIQPCLQNQTELLHEKLLYGNYKDPFSKKIAKLAEHQLLSEQLGNVAHHCPPIRLLPEYELHNMWYGTDYDLNKINKIKECLSKKIPYNKIKSILTV